MGIKFFIYFYVTYFLLNTPLFFPLELIQVHLPFFHLNYFGVLLSTVLAILLIFRQYRLSQPLNLSLLTQSFTHPHLRFAALLYLCLVGLEGTILLTFFSDLPQRMINRYLLLSINLLSFLFLLGLVKSQFGIQRLLRFLLRPYLVISVGTSLLVIFGFLLGLLHLEFPEIWVVSEKIYDESGGERGFYFPYFLSLILIENHPAISYKTLLGVPIIYSSGWFYEPNMMTFFTAPSLFLLKDIHIKYRNWISGIILASLLLSGSMTLYTALFFIALIYTFYRSRRYFMYILLTISILSIVFWEKLFHKKSLLMKITGASGREIREIQQYLLGASDFWGKNLSMMHMPSIEGSAGGLFSLLYYAFFASIFVLIVKKLKNHQLGISFAFLYFILHLQKSIGFFFLSVSIFFVFTFLLFIEHTNQLKEKQKTLAL